MKKLFAAVFSLIILTAVMALPASAVGESLDAAYGTPVIDGVVDDLWKKANRQKLQYVSGGANMHEKRRTCSAYVSAMWDEEALYFLIEAIDDDFVFSADGANDSVSVYLDEADLFGETWKDGQTLLSIVPEEGARVLVREGEAGEGSRIAYSLVESTRYIEIKYVPTQFELKRGRQILADFKYNDYNADGVLEYCLAWSDELGEGDIDSSNWSYVTLSNARTTGFSDAERAAASILQTLIEDYDFIDGSDGYDGEGADKLWDGDTGTKFCTSEFPNISTVKLDEPYYITGILMATANDNESYSGRNPDDWKIEASTDGEKWVTLADGDDDFLKDVNRTYFARSIIPSETPYSYIRFYNRSSEADLMQLSEVMVCGLRASSSQKKIDELLNPTSNEAIDDSMIKYLEIAGPHARIFSDDIADPTEPNNNAGSFDSYTTTIITIISFTVILVGACVVIVMLQAKREKNSGAK